MDYSSSHPQLGGCASGDQEHAFSKSVSEPSICSPCSATPSPSSSSTEGLPHPSLSPYPSPMPSNASSAPATPQPSRSPGTKGSVDPPPRPATTPSSLATGAARPHNKVVSPPPKGAIHFVRYIPALSLLILADLQRESIQPESFSHSREIQTSKRPSSSQTPGPGPRLPSYQTQGRKLKTIYTS